MKNQMRSFSRILCSLGLGIVCYTGGIAHGASPELLCGMDNVEDLVALPNSPWIIGSGINLVAGGGLHLINSTKVTGWKLDLDFSSDLVAHAPYDQCPSAPDASKFNAHGINLKTIGDGTYNLFVVNHGGRESIEVFRVTPSDAEPKFNWIGCVLAPEKSNPNSVAARSDGGIVLTSFGTGLESSIAKLENGEKSGAVYEWQRETGWNMIADSSLRGNNGLELSTDEKWAYVAEWGGSSVSYIPLDPSFGTAQEIKLDFLPDNIRRTYDGQLTVTGHISTVKEFSACLASEAGLNCMIDYKSVLINPETLDVTPLYESTETTEFDAATTTLKTKDALWMGAFMSNCVAKVTLPLQE